MQDFFGNDIFLPFLNFCIIYNQGHLQAQFDSA